MQANKTKVCQIRGAELVSEDKDNQETESYWVMLHGLSQTFIILYIHVQY